MSLPPRDQLISFRTDAILGTQCQSLLLEGGTISRGVAKSALGGGNPCCMSCMETPSLLPRPPHSCVRHASTNAADDEG